MPQSQNPSVMSKKNFPTKRTPKVLNDILDAIRSGATQALAAQYAGIHKDTLNEWLKEGEHAEEDNPLAQFYVEFHQARGEQAKITLEKIRAISEQVNSWQGLAWWLEKVFPRDYGRGLFGTAPDEVPEIKHVIEVHRDEDAKPPALPQEHGTTRYQLSGSGMNGEGDDEPDITEFPVIMPVD